MGDTMEFVAATPWRVARLLKDPAYAGAYSFGPSQQRVVLEEGRKRRRKEKRPRPEQWEVLILDHHLGYITWPEYLRNQERLAQNRNALGAMVPGAARAGKSLLAGLVRCGHCGRKMRVRYSGRRRGSVVYYYCVAPEQLTPGRRRIRLHPLAERQAERPDAEKSRKLRLRPRCALLTFETI